ncbi:MAG: alpha-L-fucosidase [Candidatus Aminicenantes bacterium]|nr:alpha-L-fucosidase [Candidatus Aminicenantes bacterium]
MISKKAASFFVLIATAAAVPAIIIWLGREQKKTVPARNYALIEPGEAMNSIVRKAAGVVPAPRQWAWQSREFAAFFHFGVNTFTDREWGDGTEDPGMFNPTDFDARQWVWIIKSAGMKTLILTAKHHDGFCLWPSAETTHSVKSSPWRGGKGDVVGEVAAACREFGIGFGFYLSPWDRHEPSYGDSPRYNEHFRRQLRELLTNYGPVAEVWFDGACGEGPNGKRQEYDWASYYRTIREIQPEALVAIMGPDARWVGRESGTGRETEWSVLPVRTPIPVEVAASTDPFAMDAVFVPRDLTDVDLGSREKLAGATALIWYPAETDVSIRPGWFYHASQDGEVKSPERLLEIYESSIGRNGVLLLNIPPDKRGRIHENDEKSLRGLRRILDLTYGTNLAAAAAVRASGAAAGHGPKNILDDDPDTFWTTPEGGEKAEIEIDLSAPAEFDRLVLQEYIRAGQRVEGFSLDIEDGGAWKPLARGTTIGFKRILRFPPVSARKVRLVVEKSRTNPMLSSFGLYRSPVKGEAR